MRWSYFLSVLLLMLSLVACRSDPVERALRGEYEPEFGNQVIFGYCQTCHIHRTFNPSEHVARVRPLYDREPYTVTSQCRACHLVSEDTWNVKHRKTIFPADVVQQRYTAHERRFLQKNPEFPQASK